MELRARRTTDKDTRSYLTAAIGDVNKVHIRLRGPQ